MSNGFCVLYNITKETNKHILLTDVTVQQNLEKKKQDFYKND